MNINVKNLVFQSFNERSFLITIKKNYNVFFYRKKKLDHYFSFTSRNENFLDQKVYLFYLKSLQSKNVILLYDFINFMNFGDVYFWFYEIIVCNILVYFFLLLGIIYFFSSHIRV